MVPTSYSTFTTLISILWTIDKICSTITKFNHYNSPKDGLVYLFIGFTSVFGVMTVY